MRDLATLGPDEVAVLIGASEWWVREQARRRNVPHLRFGRDQINSAGQMTVAMGSCPWAATKVPTDGHGFCPVVATNLPNLLVG